MTPPATVSKVHLVLLALHQLGAESDLESIAQRAWELFPEQFSWQRFPQYPDKDLVRIHLSMAKRNANGPLVADHDLRLEPRSRSGKVKRYALTEAGRQVAEEVAAFTAIAPLSAGRSSLDHRRLVEPVLRSAAFLEYSSGASIQQIGREGFLAAFQLFGDASAYVITGRLARVEAAVAAASESNERNLLTSFIRNGRETFRF